ncbi:repressor of RNA polymerase III transcription MAF1 [Canna indica]|uniref:Repressor of RNA polymerase III transcription MAF1 n=1 Tax=Canna indica TaxID=4628 RepID=A0AAQ3K6X5_9LILI|nr:repressor of RNA polymerase III transcription MAF1 [Canna indica]
MVFTYYCHTDSRRILNAFPVRKGLKFHTDILLTIANMKFLEFSPLDSINVFLNHLNLGESTIKGNLEAFSCKQTGSDRKLSFSLEHEILDYLGQSSDSDSSSPIEYLSTRSSRKTLIYLILTLSHMYPDYDFSAILTYFKDEEWENFKQIFENYLFDAAKEWTVANPDSCFLDSITKAIDEENLCCHHCRRIRAYLAIAIVAGLGHEGTIMSGRETIGRMEESSVNSSQVVAPHYYHNVRAVLFTAWSQRNPRRRGKKDPGWDHDTLVNPGKATDGIKCNYCGKVTKGGISRHKEQLVGGYRNATACKKKVPEYVKVEMKEHMEAKKKVKNAMDSVPHFDELVEE